MTSRCHSEVNGCKKMSQVAISNQELYKTACFMAFSGPDVAVFRVNATIYTPHHEPLR